MSVCLENKLINKEDNYIPGNSNEYIFVDVSENEVLYHSVTCTGAYFQMNKVCQTLDALAPFFCFYF